LQVVCRHGSNLTNHLQTSFMLATFASHCCGSRLAHLRTSQLAPTHSLATRTEAAVFRWVWYPGEGFYVSQQCPKPATPRPHNLLLLFVDRVLLPWCVRSRPLLPGRLMVAPSWLASLGDDPEPDWAASDPPGFAYLHLTNMWHCFPHMCWSKAVCYIPAMCSQM
jgi:hypothetical protein